MLMSESLNLIISRLHWWAVKLKAIIKKKWSWEFALLQFECVACMMCQCAVLLNTKLSSATCLTAVNICWDTEVKYVTDRVHWLSMLVEKDTHNWHGARYHGRHGERRLCAYQMLDALCLCWSCLVHTVDCFMNEGYSVYDQVIIFTCFVCLLPKQHTTLKWKSEIFVFPVLQGSADTLVRRGGKSQHLSIAYFLRNIPAENY